jgi:hypothetical protein
MPFLAEAMAEMAAETIRVALADTVLMAELAVKFMYPKPPQSYREIRIAVTGSLQRVMAVMVVEVVTLAVGVMQAMEAWVVWEAWGGLLRL